MDTHMTSMVADAAASPVAAVPGLAESVAINELATALSRAQGAFHNPEKDRRNPHFGSCYATLGAVIEATRKPLAENGLSLTQTVGGRPPVLRTRLLHSSGQWLASEVPLYAAGKGSQVFGSELTYMRRYAVCALLNIAPAEGDDDGNAAQVAAEAEARAARAPRDGAQPGNSTAPATRGNGNAAPSHEPSRAQASRPAPAKPHGDLREAEVARRNGESSAPSASPRQPDAAPARSASPWPAAGPQASPTPEQPIEAPTANPKASRQAAEATRRRKDEAAPPSVWGILRPGKPGVTAPDGAAWLAWWTTRAVKAAAEGKRDELRALFEANAAGWDQIALGSAEGQEMVARASEAVRAVLDG